MVLLGVIVNTLAIIVGTLIGLCFANIPEGMKSTVLKVLGIAVVVLGMGMAFEAEYFLNVLFSVVFGAILGEWLKVEDHLERLGQWIEHKAGKHRGNVAKAFVTTTLIFTIGAMSVIGSLNSGLNLDHDVLYTKAFLDGFVSIIFASTLGIGVIFSAIPVFVYQGALALFATTIDQWLTPELLERLVNDITATGGILIIGIGLNLLEVTKLKVGNLLPALVVAVLVGIGVYMVQGLMG
ncbi:putative membrane protein YqgA involved in biofilm formation [Caldalkalibacillus uzonensis]|uniref:Membrane protein YqgA involved in biofilm formation n=1 Tax=Caldalkalibacillus uzonensis TaxID=353224 RepID=A0ABU0CT56_9BACI|nr:DUF554 domain-containing protein [Caldalkalibacillus uzonensis]MDQ0339288.1 putative membrane protein YqgA involved in biofilm formation [Caldalkalibacillus uzonensis]